MSDLPYRGGELELFAQARHWKEYWGAQVRPHLGRAVLEVGAGIGSNTLLLHPGGGAAWVCLEPDARLAAMLRRRVADLAGARTVEVRVSTLASLSPAERFDTVLYLDVLEHIADDRGEMELAARHLAPGGNLVILAPAHRWLFSPFDQAIGHYRRYTLGALTRLTPAGLRVAQAIYLDSVGLLASAANRLVLRQASPSPKQLAFWDRVMVPCSRLLDRLTGQRLGKSVFCRWERPAASSTNHADATARTAARAP